MRALAQLVLLSLALVPSALAGSSDAPEVTDAAGDASCYAPAGNEWSDIVSAWVSDETATSFKVNIQLAKWTHDALGSVSGYTLQFTHQGKQFGVVALYAPPPAGDGWEFSNGYIDLGSGEGTDFSSTEGTFTPGTPALLSIAFDKTHFPHEDANDTRLVDLKGGSADFKNQVPSFVGGPSGEFTVCDLVESAAVYEFQVGGHTTHQAPSDPATDAAAAGATTADAATAAPEDAGTGGSTPPEKQVPGPGVALVVLALVLALHRRR